MIDREALEKAVAEIDGYVGLLNPDGDYDIEELTRDAITAYMDAMRAKGFAMMPREPTLAMQKAYFDSIDAHMGRVETDPYFGRFDNHRLAYAAMISAHTSDTQERE